MTHWRVQALILEPDEITFRGIETFTVATDGGREGEIYKSLQRAFMDCTLSAAGPWKWYVWLEKAAIPVNRELDPAAQLLNAMTLEPHFAHSAQIRHLEALPLVKVTAQTPTGVVLAYDSTRPSTSKLRLPQLVNMGLAIESEGIIKVDFRTDDPRTRNRQLRALVNYLILRFDPHDPLTRQVIGEPLP